MMLMRHFIWRFVNCLCSLTYFMWGNSTWEVLTGEGSNRYLTAAISRIGNCIIKDDKWQSWRTRGEIGRLSWNIVVRCCNGTWIGFSSFCVQKFLMHLASNYWVPSPKMNNIEKSTWLLFAIRTYELINKHQNFPKIIQLHSL